jgi:hypothetical protein
MSFLRGAPPRGDSCAAGKTAAPPRERETIPKQKPSTNNERLLPGPEKVEEKSSLSQVRAARCHHRTRASPPSEVLTAPPRVRTPPPPPARPRLPSPAERPLLRVSETRLVCHGTHKISACCAVRALRATARSHTPRPLPKAITAGASRLLLRSASRS